nr:MAG TPA: hypothetical protein [Caudoviricetes sp.]
MSVLSLVPFYSVIIKIYKNCCLLIHKIMQRI